MKFDNGFKNEYVAKYVKPSMQYENVFTEEQLKELAEFMFRKTETWRTSPTGNLFFRGNFKTLAKDFVVPIIKDIVKDEIDFDKVTTYSGNFFHTPHQYGIHTDMPEIDNTFEKDDITYRSLLIPLYLEPKHNKSKIVFYDQRVVDSGCTFDNGGWKSTTHYRSFDDYTLIDNVYTIKDGWCDIETVNKMTEDEFVKHELFRAPSPIERYNGLTIENSFDWQPGSLYTFDTASVHSSTIGKPFFKCKGGLRISLITKRDYVNYK